MLRGVAGIQHDQRALGEHPDAAAVLDGGKALQNRFVRDVEAFLAQGKGGFHRDGGAARRVAAQKGQRGGIAAVVHLAGELFRFEEGDVIRVGDHQFAVLPPGSHDQLTEHGLGLVRCGDADRALPHDARRQRSRPLQRTAHAVRADGRHHADRHVGQRLGKASVRQFHHGQTAARRAEADRRSRQFRRRAGQGLAAAELICSGAEQPGVHGVPVDADALGQRLAARVVQAGDEARGLEHRSDEGSGCGLARRTGCAHIRHLLRRSGQSGAQFLRRGKPLRQSGKVFICPIYGHCVNPRFDVCKAGCTYGSAPAG